MQLVWLAMASWLVYVAITFRSHEFAYEVPAAERPLIVVLLLLALNFFLHLWGIRCALRVDGDRALSIVVVAALAFRGVMVFSEPIQEIDIYRYMWDGLATTHGVSPFRYAPEQVLLAAAEQDMPAGLRTLVQLRDASSANHELLSRIHFGQLPTVYPPTSQAVFALAAWSTPSKASLGARLLVMKGWLLLFDVATIFLISATLRSGNLHPGWLVTYAWSPLVLKEFANSGHLDSIAVCLCTAAVWIVGRTLHGGTDGGRFLPVLGGFALFSLAVGAKLYPIVLTPLLLAGVIRRFGWLRGIATAVATGFGIALLLMPLLWSRATPDNAAATPQDPFATEPADIPEPPLPPEQLTLREPPVLTGPRPAEAEPPLPPDLSPAAAKQLLPVDPSAGLRAFLSSWMMNDFLFLNTIENLTPNSLRATGKEPWFVITPDANRESVVNWASRVLHSEPSHTPFLLARSLLAFIFIVLAICWAWQSVRVGIDAWFEYVFLTVAWFWLLLPTLNPWYWIWALPWVGMARNRVWLWLAGLVLIYYVRFYLQAHFAEQPVVPFCEYTGEPFYDYVVVWFEYVPWFVCLMAGHLRNRRGGRVSHDTDGAQNCRSIAGLRNR